MKALILIDLQQDFLPGGALGVPHGEEIIPLVNLLQEQFRYVVATKDWHPPHHISFASTHEKKVGEIQKLWPAHCIQESTGAEFALGLKQEQITKVIFKGVDPHIDSYSAFFDNAHLRATGLGDYLHSLRVDEIYIAGLATDYCVKYSVLDAVQLGFKVSVIVDACRGIELEQGDCARALEEMSAAGAHLLESRELLPTGDRVYHLEDGI